jgi:hypothetical protein
LLHGKESSFSQSGIDPRGTVTFAQDKSIPVRPIGLLRLNAKDFAIQYSQQISHRER